MDDLLNQLEVRLRGLVERYESLQQDCTRLQLQQQATSNEKQALLAKNRIAVSQIEAIVARLKSMEDAIDE